MKKLCPSYMDARASVCKGIGKIIRLSGTSSCRHAKHDEHLTQVIERPKKAPG